MARLRRLWLENFRNYETLELELARGTTVIIGANGQGKSNLVEAVGWLGTRSSFRGVPTDALVRTGAGSAIIRAEVVRDDRELLVEAELVPGRQLRVQVNRQRVTRTAELAGLVPTTVFSPDDLELVKGGPGRRRGYLDDVLVQGHHRHAALRADLERVIRQRNALLRQSGGRRSTEIDTTLAVWNTKLVECGEALADAREALLERLTPHLRQAYVHLAAAGDLVVRYEAPWREQGLAAALAEVEADELRRGVSLVGPHRDEITLVLDGRPTRTHSSQGEQRTVALAMRMAAHLITREAHDTAPVLVLDDVFSELDPQRASAILVHLEADQTLITSADRLPATELPLTVLEVEAGRVTPVG